MKRKGLLLKTNIYLLSAVALTLLLTFTIISIRTTSLARTKAKEMAGLKARKVASDVRSYLNQTMETNKTLAITIQSLHQDKILTRQMMANILRDLLINNKHIYATWTMWEANAFDGKDALYARKHNQIHGRFACSYYRVNDTLIKQNFGNDSAPAYLSSDLLYEYEDDYYQIAMTQKEEVITPPYYYSFTNDSNNMYYMTSLVSPIFLEDKVAGVVATDINLEELQTIVLKSSIYKTGFAAIVANNFKMVAHPTADYIEKHITNLYGSVGYQISNAIKNDRPYSYQTISELDGKKVIRYFYPVLIRDVKIPWAVMVEIPSDEIFNDAQNLSILIIIIGIVGFIIITLIIYNIIKNITKPIGQVVKLAQNISMGKLQDPPGMPLPALEIKELHQALKLMVEKLKMMQEILLLGTWELDIKTLNMNWSDGLFRLFGFNPHDFFPDLNILLEKIHPEDQDSIGKLFNTSARNNSHHIDHRFKIIHADKTVRHMLMRCGAVSDQSGNIQKKIGVMLDITALTQNEENLKESEAKFRNIFDSSNDAILIVNTDGNFIDANKTAFIRSGLSREELLAHNYKDFLSKDPDNKDLQYKEALFNGIDTRFETKYTNAYGQTIHIEVNGQAMKYKGKDSFVLISRDITERKEAGKRIIQAIVQTEEDERGRFARELHDGVSPILSAIKLYANAITDNSSKEFQGKITKKIISAVDEAIQGIYDISNNLTPHVLQNFGFKTALETFIKKIEESTSIIFEVQYHLNKRHDNTIEVTLYRLATELINNTIKYANASQVTISLTENEMVEFHYADNGCGFNKEEAKDNKTSTGLFNLTNRVQSLDGQINITSSPGHGMNLDAKIPIPKK
ncbi:PAS domain S-box protein [Labilibacter sediminis]|nr:PAS domain S-box protein [Labilibacter sediminis]